MRDNPCRSLTGLGQDTAPWYTPAMAELKTQKTNQDPKEFLKTIEPAQKRADGLALLALFERVTGKPGVMWGSSIVGFGQYHYKSARSTQEGDWPRVGFSPRKQNLTLYIMTGNQDSSDLVDKLGPHKKSGGCLYLNKLSDVDEGVLSQLITRCLKHMNVLYPE
jgi:hypothetical protein